MTSILLFFNYTNECSPQTSFSSCFFLDINMMHIVHVLIANSILFGMHIYEKFIKGDVDFKKYTIKSILIVDFSISRLPFLKNYSLELPFIE